MRKGVSFRNDDIHLQNAISVYKFFMFRQRLKELIILIILKWDRLLLQGIIILLIIHEMIFFDDVKCSKAMIIFIGWRYEDNSTVFIEMLLLNLFVNSTNHWLLKRLLLSYDLHVMLHFLILLSLLKSKMFCRKATYYWIS